MRNIGLILIILPGIIVAQVNIDFESKDLAGWIFSDSGRWSIDSIYSIGGNYSLHHSFDNSEAGSDMAAYPIPGLEMSLGSVTWSFKIRYGCSPSSSNRWAVFLNSDAGPEEMRPGGDVNGFLVGVNISGYDDTLRLWRISDASVTEVISTSLNWQNDIGIDSVVTINVSRSPPGSWEIGIEDNDGFKHTAGVGVDNEIFNVNYFGIYYNYTSSRDRLLWIDNISIEAPFIEDNRPPELLKAEFISNTTIQIRFDEHLSSGWNRPENYRILQGQIIPEKVILSDANTVLLKFSGPLSNKTAYTLTTEGICDIPGNCSERCEVSVLLVCPEWGDIVISEFMSDPVPSVNLGSVEYIELYNRSGFPVNTRSISIVNGNNSSELPDRVILPGEYLVLCDEDDLLSLTQLTNKVGILNMVGLNNSNDYILISDTLAYTLHGIEYNHDWFNNTLKEEGGWSMEMIDTDYPFSGSRNWACSTDSDGGTPGFVNSVSRPNIDIWEPRIESVFPISEQSVRLKFSEPVSDISCQTEDQYIDNKSIGLIERIDSLRREFILYLNEPLAQGTIYTGTFTGIYDYGGNQVRNQVIKFGLPGHVSKNDLVINELLFEPLQSEEEYIELYNRSEKIVDAASLRVASVNLQTGDTGTISQLSEESRCILPNSYYAISKDRTAVLDRYFTSDADNIYEIEKIPSMPNDRGKIFLLGRDLTMIDNLAYDRNYHFDLISGTTGVSLERINPEGESNDNSNWHSASGLSGWGTPGVENSVRFIADSSEASSIILSSKRITPDGDGIEDILTIRIYPGVGTWTVKAIIYDDQGYVVNQIVRNSTSSGSEYIHWDGTDADGNTLKQGIYIIYIRSVSDTGKVKQWKRVCALLRH